MFQDERMLNLAKLMDVSMQRARLHAANIANQNTPGYRTRRLAFEGEFRRALAAGDAAAARRIAAEVYEPEDLAERKDGNNVSTQAEVTAAAENMLLYNTYSTMLRGKFRILDAAIARSP